LRESDAMATRIFSRSYLTLSDVLTIQGKNQEAFGFANRPNKWTRGLALVGNAWASIAPAGVPHRRAGGLTRMEPDPVGLRDPGHLGATCIELGLFPEAQGYLKEAVQINPRQSKPGWDWPGGPAT